MPLFGAVNEPVKIVALKPAPNYPLTQDEADASQLTDGQPRRFPFWTRRHSVGWQKSTPVLISGQVKLVERAPYELVLRTGQRLRARVQVPRRIDVYCARALTARAVHVGQLIPETQAPHYDGVVELHVPFVGCAGGVLQIVAHAQGSFLMLDQLTLHRVESDAPTDQQMRLYGHTAVVDPLVDSRARLEKHLLGQARQRLIQQVTSTGTSGSQAWLDAPWIDLDGTVGQETLELTRLPTQVAAWVLGIANNGSAVRHYGLEQAEPEKNLTEVSYLPSLLTADGRFVFDALRPAEAAHWRLAPGEVAYFLLRESADVPAGQRRLTVRDDTGWSRRLEVRVEVLDGIRPVPHDAPRTLVWSYTTDRPIWQKSNAEELVQALSQAGVNVFVVPPWHIPLPFDQHDLERRLRDLHADLDLYRGRGLVLLFSGAPVWEEITASLKDPIRRAVLQRWATRLVETMADVGIPPDQWALYPVDEIRGANLTSLADLIEIMREQEPDLQFYANPLAGRGQEMTQLSDLRRLAPLVDYWQPRAGTAFHRVRAVLRESADLHLWLYDNPCEPARATSPEWYRALGRRAYDAGAAGFGFWSFSGTSGSSAWSDLDGIRPDWAAVYEADDGVVTSRRWEAFQAGIRDYAALKFCGRHSNDDPLIAAACATHRRSLPHANIRCLDWRQPQ